MSGRGSAGLSSSAKGRAPAIHAVTGDAVGLVLVPAQVYAIGGYSEPLAAIAARDATRNNPERSYAPPCEEALAPWPVAPAWRRPSRSGRPPPVPVVLMKL